MGKTKQVQPHKDQIEGITLSAIFSKATTTIDGGWNITFSVSQDNAEQVMQVAEFRETLLQLAVVPIDG